MMEEKSVAENGRGRGQEGSDGYAGYEGVFVN